MSYVQLSEGGFQVVYPLGLWSQFSGVGSPELSKFDSDTASKLFTFTFTTDAFFEVILGIAISGGYH